MIRVLSRSIGNNKLNSLLAPAFVSLEVVLEIFIPTLMASLIDKGIEPGNMGYILRQGGLMALACVCSLFCGMASGYCAAKASAGFARNLRRNIFYNVQTFSFGNIDKFSTSSIITRLTTDVTNVQNAYMMIIRTAVRSPFMLIFAMSMSFSVSVKLTLIFVAAVPILGVALFSIIRVVHPIFRRVFKTYDRLNEVVEENLRGIRVVKAYVREDHENEKFRSVSGRIYDDFVKAEKTLAFNMPFMQTAVYSCLLLITWFASRIIVNSGATELTTGQLTSLISYVTRILISLMMLSMIFVQLTLSRASADRICEILSEKSSLTDPPAPLYKVGNGEIVFENVTFSYSEEYDKPCLDNVDLKIPSGATVGIIGGTGSSKSTMVQLIPRLYDCTKGSVRVAGHNVREYDIEVLRDSVAIVLQKNVLFSGTIEENLRWGKPDATDEEMETVCRAAQAHDFIMSFPDGYRSRVEQGGSNFSGGQRQRLCIARALLKNPKIIIFDDSTSAVDMHTDAMIRRALSQTMPEVTKLIIAQRIDSVKDSDMIIVLDDGKIDGIGTHDELLENNQIYREVYLSQTRGNNGEEATDNG
ncbi:MAG: ABC transporter ATP-binding protein/permease [Clostridia bacterium]|nr:ABC transporter ATP-binding protein/permease [Clostridia bacterium]